MKSIKIHFINMRTYFLNFFKKSEEIDESKVKWNELAEKNAAYYIMTDKSKSDSEESFKLSGEQDVRKFFLEDEVLHSVISTEKKAKVLEIGCGTGRLSEFIAPHVQTLHAVDISEKMILQAQQRLHTLTNAVFTATDGMSFQLEDDSIDVVFSYIVFQHMPSIDIVQKNINEISRILKSSGVAKIQLRGVPTNKDNWFYGPSFNTVAVKKLLQGTDLSLLKTDGEGQKNFWVWLQKRIS